MAGRIAGIGRYVLEICRALDELMPEAEFFLYSPQPLTVEPPSARWQVRIGGSRAASSYAWLKWSARVMAKADGVQVFWATRTILPGRTDGFRTVSTVHDLNYRIFPKSMPHATLWAHRLWFARDVRRADAVVTNSRGTADRLCTMLGVEADGVARPGVSAVFGPQAPEVVSARLSALNVRQPYFLAVGTVEPRKNLAALMEAFVSLKRSGRLPEYALLIAGSRGWRGRRLQVLLHEAEVYGVRWLGFVSDHDLAALYAGAKAFVFPSLYEGFGIPAAEARACGARVVATDMPELREAGGPEGLYIEPTVAGIRKGLMSAAGERQLPNQWEHPFSWKDAAEVMAAQFRALA
ncbi:Glycosyltransferase involved in cell wall bisynthesis [Desulfacinum hydrothermale DSM 13146]|uniref:Glycosyltransferase involved in cell wall bisynthesis n=1 Tax=Desulfacinum hydrothermale DSM 13146 TaxID=1121390 RepID=A0A1W1XFS4_9BACT|nr:glycosyltransferase family 1 protein [Desulfacinum hydrothermale]SMC22448.1 Glycosyltransferase involved in cell wall bisynthesis [Desulfacinum hydrothermale DSM 13146]